MINKALAVLHDQRGVARIFNMTFNGKKLLFWREDEDMYQRMTIEIADDGLYSIAEASDDKGKTWRKDLEMTHKRITSITNLNNAKITL